MPKVSTEHKERRREEILEGAHRAFAQHGYEGATVSRLEQEIGLSRGAIFSYFENKDALFVAAFGRSSNRLVEIWLDRGFRELLEAIAHEDPDWLSVQFEATRRLRTDEGFRREVEKLEHDVEQLREDRAARLRELVRDDVPIQVVAQFLSLVANGLALARTTGEDLPDLDLLNQLVESGVGRR